MLCSLALIGCWHGVLPKIKDAIDLPKATAAIVKAVTDGETDPSTGEFISRVFERHIKAIETADCEERLQVLEEQQR